MVTETQHGEGRPTISDYHIADVHDGARPVITWELRGADDHAATPGVQGAALSKAQFKGVVLMDRDGVINRMRRDYVKRWEELELLPGSLDAIARLVAAGREIVVLSNQSAIGRGLVSLETVEEINRRLRAAIERNGGAVRAFLVCPHRPEDGCTCRKPRPGLFLRARDELGVDLASAVMIGDQASDMEAARAAGCKAILVDPEGDVAGGSSHPSWPVVRNLAEATELILAGF